MNRVHVLPILLIASLFLAAGCGQAPEVFQGKTVAYDAGTKILTLKNQQDENDVRTFSLEGAEVGADPVVDDDVRLAYYKRDDKLVAVRVMNLTRQDEIGALKKKK